MACFHARIGKGMALVYGYDEYQFEDIRLIPRQITMNLENPQTFLSGVKQP